MVLLRITRVMINIIFIIILCASNFNVTWFSLSEFAMTETEESALLDHSQQVTAEQQKHEKVNSVF